MYLKAAHCFSQKFATKTVLPGDVLAIFGAHDLDDLNEIGRFELSPKKITLHDDWNPETFQYDADLSVLEFEEGSISYNNYVQPISILDSADQTVVTVGTVTGWGRSKDTSKFHETVSTFITVAIQANEDCLPGEPRLAAIASRRTFCAGMTDGSGVCHGDSGGGLFIEIDGIKYFEGIVSSSLTDNGMCDVSKNAIYTNVRKFKDWIAEKTQSAVVSSTTRPITTSTQHVASDYRLPKTTTALPVVFRHRNLRPAPVQGKQTKVFSVLNSLDCMTCR